MSYGYYSSTNPNSPPLPDSPPPYSPPAWDSRPTDYSSIITLSQSTFTSSVSSSSSSLGEKRKISSFADNDFLFDNNNQLKLANPFQNETNTYISQNNELWHTPPNLRHLIICLFKGMYPTQEDCEKNRFNSNLATRLTTAVDLLVSRIVTNKEREGTHDLLFQLYFLRAAFDNAPHYAKVATETLQKTIDTAIITICSNLTLSERGQVVRYANILDIPDRENAKTFRALIQPCLYRRERVGEATSFEHWASHQEILDYTIKKLQSITTQDKLSPEYIPLDEFLKNSIPDTKNCISCAAGLIPILETFKIKLMNGIEVQLPKYFHSVTDPINTSNQILTASYFEQDFETASQNPLSTFVFTNAIDIASKKFSEPYVAFPATPLEWNSDSQLLSYFTPEESAGFQEEKWLQFSDPLPIHMWNASEERVRPYSHMIVSYEVSEQKKELDPVLKRLKTLNSFGSPIEIPVITPIECHILCYFLRHFPLFIPQHFPTESKVNSDQIKELVRPIKKAKTNADHTNQFATGILTPVHSSAQTHTLGAPIDVQQRTGFIKTIREVQAAMASLTVDASDHYLLRDPSLDSSYLKENFKSSGLGKNDPLHIRPLIKLTLDEPLRIKEASLAGLFSKPFTNKDPDLEIKIQATFERYKEKREFQKAQLNENKYFKDKKLEEFFPPVFRHLWEGDPEPETCTQLVGYHPLILFNSQALQSALFHLSFEIIRKDCDVGRTRFLNLKEEGTRTIFFRNLAYEILSNCKIIEEKSLLILSWREYEFLLDWRTFETISPEGYNDRPTPNEPFFTKKLQEILKKSYGGFHQAYNWYLNKDKYPPNIKSTERSALEFFNTFVEELGFAIYKRYFASREHLQTLTIPNTVMEAIMAIFNARPEEILNGSLKKTILATTAHPFITPDT